MRSHMFLWQQADCWLVRRAPELETPKGCERLVSKANELARQGGSFVSLQAAGSLKFKKYLKVE